MTTELVAFLAAAGFGAVIGLERQAGKHDESVVFGARTPSPSTECGEPPAKYTPRPRRGLSALTD